MLCDCSNNNLEPICGINGLTYFSPCHAGCTQFNNNNLEPNQYTMNFTACSCILGDHLRSEVIMSPVATSGPCKSTCQNLLPFLILLVSVRDEERCFALGMQFVILRLFAYIPAPMVFGHIIDTACLLWKQKCGDNGSCLIYNIEMFRYRYVGTSAVLKIVGGTLFTIVWFMFRQKNQREKERQLKGLSVTEMMNSVTSINKLNLSSKSTASGKLPCDQASDDSDQEENYNLPEDTDLDQASKPVKDTDLAEADFVFDHEDIKHRNDSFPEFNPKIYVVKKKSRQLK
ncbi:SO5A1-like protein [Mya arenaria]|uniref:SO5A1-like protein n=1 Tax=Mya arenaria TaxID=6604 RepID=A0ABY7F7A4_MYAAR|nr:SO5A1-like protein [Mya arenaria]